MGAILPLAAERKCDMLYTDSTKKASAEAGRERRWDQVDGRVDCHGTGGDGENAKAMEPGNLSAELLRLERK